MVAIGDVFSIVAALVGICVTAWALIMGSALLFQNQAVSARDAYRRAPWKGFFLGLGISAVLGFASAVMVQMPVPGVKLLGTLIYLSLMAVAALGASGIALLISDRIATLDPSVSRYGALIRAASILVMAGVFPLLGWFLVGPVLIIASLGYGTLAIAAQARALANVPPIVQ